MQKRGNFYLFEKGVIERFVERVHESVRSLKTSKRTTVRSRIFWSVEGKKRELLVLEGGDMSEL